MKREIRIYFLENMGIPAFGLLSKLVDVQKAKIARPENGASNVTIGTVLKVFKTLKAKVNFKVEMMNKTLKII